MNSNSALLSGLTGGALGAATHDPAAGIIGPIPAILGASKSSPSSNSSSTSNPTSFNSLTPTQAQSLAPLASALGSTGASAGGSAGGAASGAAGAMSGAAPYLALAQMLNQAAMNSAPQWRGKSGGIG